MAFHVRVEKRPAAEGDDRIWVLEDDRGQAMEISPSRGFNWYRWVVQVPGETEGVVPLELMFATNEFFTEGRPTRSGNPILFPFPNRIRDGKYTWQGSTFELPTNDPARKNAIHGFVCRSPWRLVEQGADAEAAWVVGEFQASRDGSAAQALWPADYLIRVHYRFEGRKVRLSATMVNTDKKDLPYGLGYHPYFRVDPFGGEETLITVPARKYWPLDGNLPMGERLPVDGPRDLRQDRRCGDLQVDDVLADLEISGRNEEGLAVIGSLRHPALPRKLEVLAGPEFREVVVFNPPHRQAFCIEPYTCTTDAINLQQRGFDGGWRLLGPGQSWTGIVDFVFSGG